MKTLSREHTITVMAADNKPALHASAGEEFVLQTHDCYGGRLQTPCDRFDPSWTDCNPATGPVFVEGARPGDVLKIEILAVEVGPQAVMHIWQGAGAVGHRQQGWETAVLPIRDGKIIFRPDLELTVQPMIGVIGTAPAEGRSPTTWPGEHGGNMDCKEIGPGSTLFLPVAVPGALLAAGDIHAAQADGEVCICAAETAGAIRLRASIAASALPTPALLTPRELLFLASDQTLEGAQRAVIDKAVDFLAIQVGLGINEAARLMSLVCDLRICQVVDPLKTIRLAIPLRVLAALGWTPAPEDRHV